MRRTLLMGMFIVLLFSCSDNEPDTGFYQGNLLNGVKHIYRFYSNSELGLLDINNSDNNYINSFIESRIDPSRYQFSFYYDSGGKLSKFTYNFINQKNHIYENLSYDDNGRINAFHHKTYDIITNSLFRDEYESITYENNVVFWESSYLSRIKKIEFSENKLSKWGYLDQNGDYGNIYYAPIRTYDYNGNNVSIVKTKYIDINGLQNNVTSFRVNEVSEDNELQNPLFLIPHYTSELYEIEILLNIRLLRDIPSEIRDHYSETYSLKKIIHFNDFDYLLIYSNVTCGGELYIVYDY